MPPPTEPTHKVLSASTMKVAAPSTGAGLPSLLCQRSKRAPSKRCSAVLEVIQMTPSLSWATAMGEAGAPSTCVYVVTW